MTQMKKRDEFKAVWDAVDCASAGAACSRSDDQGRRFGIARRFDISFICAHLCHLWINSSSFFGCSRHLCGYLLATADPRIGRKEKSCPQMTQMNTD